jgi:hypothetical protein
MAWTVGCETHGQPGRFGTRDRHPAVPAPLIGLQHPGGLLAEAPIEEKLDATDREPVRALPAPYSVGDEPVEGGHRRMEQHPESESVGGLEMAKGAEYLFRFHVVDSGDAQPVCLRLSLGECREQCIVRGGRDDRQH